MAFTSNVYDLMTAIQTLLQNNLIAEIQTTQPITAGDDLITVNSTTCYDDGEHVIIYDSQATGEFEAYARQVIVKPNNVLFLSAPINADITNATIQKTQNGQALQAIYVGDPPALQRYPVILIDGQVTDDQPYTLAGGFKVRYDLTISAFVEADNYQDAHRYGLDYAKQIETLLTQRINPTNACDQRAIYNSGITSIRDNTQSNDHSTLKVFHVGWFAEELVQRFVSQPPINQVIY